MEEGVFNLSWIDWGIFFEAMQLLVLVVGVFIGIRQLYLHDQSARYTRTADYLRDFYADDKLMGLLSISHKERAQDEKITIRDLKYLLNKLEAMAVFVDKKFIDNDIMKEQLEVIIRNVYSMTEKHIKQIRVRDNSKKIYKNFEKMALDWKSSK